MFGMIGPAAILGLRDLMGDAEHGEWVRIAACESLVKIVERFPETREQAVAAITDQLRRFGEQERVVSAFLVDAPCDLKAVESATVIEQAFAANMVDLSVLGDWEEAQIPLGLLEKRVTPAPNFLALEFGPLPSLGKLRIRKKAPRGASKKKSRFTTTNAATIPTLTPRWVIRCPRPAKRMLFVVARCPFTMAVRCAETATDATAAITRIAGMNVKV